MKRHSASLEIKRKSKAKMVSPFFTYQMGDFKLDSFYSIILNKYCTYILDEG
jgi:hypothetical protein